MRHGSLFSGIGGFDLAAEWMGWENVFHCEWNEFGQKVLKHYWPQAISYADIKKTDFTIHRGAIDILTGGFPCQPYSQAGKRLGKEDDRHLWPEMLRAIGEIQPGWVVGENVRGLTNWNGGLVFDEVQADLEAKGYEVLPFLLPACAVNAPHRRDRIWFIAYSADNYRRGPQCYIKEEREYLFSKSERLSEIGTSSNPSNVGCHNGCDNWQKRHIPSNERIAEKNKSKRKGWKLGASEASSVTANTSSGGLEGRGNHRLYNEKEFPESERSCTPRIATNAHGERLSSEEHRQEESGRIAKESIPNYWENFPTQSPVCNGDDGLSARLDGITFSKWRNESIKAGGNAIVPQVVYEIFKSIEQYNKL